MSWNHRITKISSIEMLEKDENLTVEIESKEAKNTFYKVSWKGGEDEESYIILNDNCVHFWHVSDVVVYLFDTYGSIFYDNHLYMDFIHMSEGVNEDDANDYLVYRAVSRMKEIFEKAEVEQRIIDKLDARISECEAGYNRVRNNY